MPAVLREILAGIKHTSGTKKNRSVGAVDACQRGFHLTSVPAPVPEEMPPSGSRTRPRKIYRCFPGDVVSFSDPSKVEIEVRQQVVLERLELEAGKRSAQTRGCLPAGPRRRQAAWFTTAVLAEPRPQHPST